jgi:hypothetical protein
MARHVGQQRAPQTAALPGPQDVKCLELTAKAALCQLLPALQTTAAKADDALRIGLGNEGRHSSGAVRGGEDLPPASGSILHRQLTEPLRGKPLPIALAPSAHVHGGDRPCIAHFGSSGFSGGHRLPLR